MRVRAAWQAGTERCRPTKESRIHALPQPREHRSQGLCRHPRLHELGRHHCGPGMGEGRVVRPRDDQGGARSRHQHLRHRQRLLGGDQRGVHRPSAEGVRRPRGRRARHQGARPDAARTQRRRALPQGDPAGDRRQPRPARDGLRRPLPDPPVGPDDADRGDDGGPARRGSRRQGPLPRRLVDVRVAVRQGAARRRAARLDAVRLDAEPLQPALPRGGAGDDPALRRPGRRGDPVEPAGPRPARPGPGTAATARSETDEFGNLLYRDEDSAIVAKVVARSPSDAGSPPAQVALAWLHGASPASPHRSSVSPSRSTSRMRSLPRIWSSRPRRSRSCRPVTSRAASPATADPGPRFCAVGPRTAANTRITSAQNAASGLPRLCPSWSGRHDEVLQQCGHPIRVAQLWHVPGG